MTSVKDNPVIQTIDRLKSIITSLVSSESSDSPDEKVDEIVELLDKLCELCSAEGSDGASIVTRNGGVELLTKLCSSLDVKSERALVSTLKSLNSIIRGMIVVIIAVYFNRMSLFCFFYIVVYCGKSLFLNKLGKFLFLNAL